MASGLAEGVGRGGQGDEGDGEGGRQVFPVVADSFLEFFPVHLPEVVERPGYVSNSVLLEPAPELAL